jgi:hypothetical protein
MTDSDLPLFAWQPPKQILLFPLTKRIGKVRHTATKLKEIGGRYYAFEDDLIFWLRNRLNN